MGEYPPFDADGFRDPDALGNMLHETQPERQSAETIEPLAQVPSEPVSPGFKAPVHYRPNFEGELNG